MRTRVTAGGTCEFFLSSRTRAFRRGLVAAAGSAHHLSLGLGRKLLHHSHPTHSDCLVHFSEPGSCSLVKDEPTTALVRVHKAEPFVELVWFASSVKCFFLSDLPAHHPFVSPSAVRGICVVPSRSVRSASVTSGAFARKSTRAVQGTRLPLEYLARRFQRVWPRRLSPHSSRLQVEHVWLESSVPPSLSDSGVLFATHRQG